MILADVIGPSPAQQLLKHRLPFECAPSPGDRLGVVEEEFEIIRCPFFLDSEINSVVSYILLVNKQDLNSVKSCAVIECQVQTGARGYDQS